MVSARKKQPNRNQDLRNGGMPFASDAQVEPIQTTNHVDERGTTTCHRRLDQQGVSKVQVARQGASQLHGDLLVAVFLAQVHLG